MRIAIAATAVCLSIIGLAAASDVEAARRPTNIPAQGLGPALQALAKDRNFQVIYISEEIEKLRTRGASGDLTSIEALTKLLDGTGLTYRYLDEKTVTILPVQHDTDNQPASVTAVFPPAAATPRRQHELQLVRIDTQDAVRPEEDEKDSSGRKAQTAADTNESATEETEIRVTGSRIRRDPAETDISPVTVFTRADIERSGAVVIADFLGRITQASGDTAVNRETGDYPISGRTSVNLRGLGNNTTLVLLNGRRLPKTGQGFGQDDYNLNGIPLASVERIEVLTNSASAIYGSDAIGGVINIITRERYSGATFTAQYGNTFRSDVSEKSLNMMLGSNGALRGGKHRYSVTLTAGANERNPLAAVDRPYTARNNYGDTGGRPPEQADEFSWSVSGAGAVLMPMDYTTFTRPPLPGMTVSMAAIPNGQDGRSLTVADFQDEGPLYTSSADTPDYRLLQSPSGERSAALSASLDITARMQLFAEGSWFDYHNEYEGQPPSATIPVPAQNPFNPFGVDVEVSKTFYELGPSLGTMENRNARFVAGVRGAFLDDWRYEISGDYSRYAGENDNSMPSALVPFYPQWVPQPDGTWQQVPTPASMAIAETDPARALNVFGDGRTTQPNDPEMLRALIGVDVYREDSDTWSASAQADGIIARLPAGMMKLAAGVEYRKEKADFYKLNTLSSYLVSLDDGAQRDLSAAFAELSAPLIGEQQQVPGVRMLQLSLAGRLDSESLFGEEVTPKAGLMWRPFRPLALRATYGYGYKTPNLKQLYEPDVTYETRFINPLPVDPVTGEVLDRWIDVRQGGNPGLNPERSTSWSAGFIYEPAWLPLFSLSVDYYDIDYTDRVAGYISPQDILTYFPERVERDPVTNLITLVDTRAINLSTAGARGVDIRLVHHIDTAGHGTFDSQLNYTYNISNTQQTTPDTPVVQNVDTSWFPRVRANASVFWNHGGFELGQTLTYESSTANQLFGGAIAPLRIRHAIVADIQGSLDLDRYRSGIASPWTEGVKLTLGINNVLDRKPSPTDGDGGYAKVDPRQRRFYLSLRKTF